MKIGRITSNISFKRNLTQEEIPEYVKTLKEAREAVNGGGKSIMIVHDACLPQAAATDTGVGHLTSKTAGQFFDFAKNTLGINAIEVLPQGEISKKRIPNLYVPYDGSAFSLGNHTIDLELLTTPEYNSVLSQEDLSNVVEANKKTAAEGLVNYENVMESDSATEKALKKAFDNFMGNREIDKTKFNEYKKANADWLESKAIYQILKRKNGGKDWTEWKNETDRNLYSKKGEASKKRLAAIKSKNKQEIDFYAFKQFIADSHLQKGRKILNEKGMKLFGDCLIGFSPDEVWANQKAFARDVFIGDPEWKLPALNYDEILKEGSPSQNLLKRKVELFAKRYDGIRFDCSWCYVEPKLSDCSTYDFKGSLLDMIEETVKEVKGKDFDRTDLIHEFEAGKEDFGILDGGGKVKSYLKDRVKVISSAYMDENYGTTEAMRKAGAGVDSYVLGVGNHDPQPLRQIAENIAEINEGKGSTKRLNQSKVLADIMNMRPEEMRSAVDFSGAKFAEPLRAKNQMVFYMDVFGRKERFDAQFDNTRKNYRFRISPDFLGEYAQTTKQGFGYNPMDGYARVFKANGLVEKHKSLYERIIKFRDIIADKVGDSVNSAKKSLSKNKLLNIGAVVVAIGLIGTVIKSSKKSLDKVQEKST